MLDIKLLLSRIAYCRNGKEIFQQVFFNYKNVYSRKNLGNVYFLGSAFMF